MRGHLGPACNAVGYVDRQVWGINHLYTGPVWIRLKVSLLYSLDTIETEFGCGGINSISPFSHFVPLYYGGCTYQIVFLSINL